MNNPNLFERIKAAYKFFRNPDDFMPYYRRKRGANPSFSVFTWADAGMETKKAPFIWPSWRMGTPQWQIVNYQSYAQEGFNENAIIYESIMYKAKAITAAPLRAYEGTTDKPELLPADHPLQNLVMRPNPYMSFVEFQGLAEVYFNLAGNCYIYVEPDEEEPDSKVPKALWLLRPDRTYIVPHPDFRRKSLKGHPAYDVIDLGQGYGDVKRKELKLSDILVTGEKKLKARDGGEKILGFYYVPEGRALNDGIPFMPEQIIHVKLPNPLDPLDGLGYGLSPVSPMARSADVDNQITKYLKLFFDKGAIPPGILTYDMPLTDAQVARARERFMEIYGGVDNWTDVAVMDYGGKYQRLSLNFDEMGFEEIDSRNETRMTGPFGVPPILVGTRIGLNRSTYSNYAQARQAFWEDTMVPELRWFEVDYQYYLQGDAGEFVQFDLTKVPALMPTANERAQRAMEGWEKSLLSRNETRAAVGFDPTEGPDVYYVPFNVQLIPVMTETDAIEEPPDTQEGMPEAGDDTIDKQREAISKIREIDKWDFSTGKIPDQKASLTADQKAAFWKQMDAQARAWEAWFGVAAEKAFRHDLREILAIISAAGKGALRNKQSVAWGMTLLSVEQYLRMEAADTWRQTFVPGIRGLIVDRGERLNADFGMEFDVRNLLAEKWFEDYTLEFAQPILETTEKELSAMFMQAQAEGWSIPMMQKRLEAIFQQWMEGDLTSEDFEWFEARMPDHRRETIARTETIKASNAGSEALYRDWGAHGKEWLATADSRTREAHQIGVTWGDPPLVVPINASFDVGGESLRYPLDPQGSPENTINCRCTVLPVL